MHNDYMYNNKLTIRNCDWNTSWR